MTLHKKSNINHLLVILITVIIIGNVMIFLSFLVARMLTCKSSEGMCMNIKLYYYDHFLLTPGHKKSECTVHTSRRRVNCSFSSFFALLCDVYVHTLADRPRYISLKTSTSQHTLNINGVNKSNITTLSLLLWLHTLLSLILYSLCCYARCLSMNECGQYEWEIHTTHLSCCRFCSKKKSI